LSNGELYTILNNKAATAKKGTIVAIIAANRTDVVISIIEKLPLKTRNTVSEITRDTAANIALITKK
jgi:transposase